MRSKQLLILIGIIILAATVRLYRIADYMTFLGDEGRDVLVVKRMLVDGDLTLLGPITSVGLMHLGPMYYYFMVPFLWLWGLNPVGPAVMVALFSLGTIGLIWIMGKEFFSQRAGAIAVLLYALSPLVIIHSRSSWNPNILPFWGLLIIYSLMKAVIKKDYKWLFVAGVAFGVSLQLHYIALVYIGITAAILALVKFRIPIKYYFAGFAGWFITFSPFIIFELRHRFINTLTVWRFVTRSGDTYTFGIDLAIARFWDLTVRLFWRVLVVESAEITIGLMLLLLVVVIWLFHTWRQGDSKRRALAVLLIWFAVGIGMMSFYLGSIYDYYLMFAFPLPFLLTGAGLAYLSYRSVGKVLSVIVVALLVFYYIKHSPLKREPNRLLQQTRSVSDFILDKVGQEPYNFALITGMNSDHAYRYFLEIGGNPPVVIENEVNDPDRKTVTDQLYVVCEVENCQPLGHSLWEVAGFGRAEISQRWQVGLNEVYKLVPYVLE